MLRIAAAAVAQDNGGEIANHVVGRRRLKAPSRLGEISTAEVLRLRATSAVSRDESVRRFAPTASRGRQDDDSVGV
jgi:hypothetical protein